MKKHYEEKIKKTQLMGILNCTPDSFFDGGKYVSKESRVAKGLEMIQEGADLIDVGGESTRPGSVPVPVEIELQRVIPVVKTLAPLIPISIDTSKPEVAEAAIHHGGRLINDVTGFQNDRMQAIVKEAALPICVMHSKEHSHPFYPNGVVEEIKEWLQNRCDRLVKFGIDPKNILIDPGIGFGKSVEQNIEILKNLSQFKTLGFPILLGISRKSFMQKILQKSVTEMLSTTLALNTMSLLQGVSMIRVHDVKEHRDIIDCLQRFLE